MRETWHDVSRPGYLGRRRDEQYRKWDEQFGAGNWRIMWKMESVTLDFQGICVVYEEAYYEFFNRNPNVLMELVCEASDIYDDNPSNVLSGLDYSKQETARTHIQDVAIRRVVARRNLEFIGDTLLQIRQEKGSHPLSVTLSPGRVPFPWPSLIIQPSLAQSTWFDPGTIEDFYQSNKYLQRRIDAGT